MEEMGFALNPPLGFSGRPQEQGVHRYPNLQAVVSHPNALESMT